MNSANKKNRGTNRFFACFRPADIDESSIKQSYCKDCLGGPVIVPDLGESVEKRSDKGEDKMVLRKILTSLSEEKSKVSSDSGEDGGRGTEERSRRSFSQILKDGLLKNSVVKKLSSRKARKRSFQTKSNIVSEKIKKASTAAKVNPAPIKSPEADSSRWTSPNSPTTVTTSTSICSPRGSSYQADSVESKQVEKPTSIENARECNSPNVGLCVLLVCLLVLVFLGRVYAVFCTSTFLFFIRRRIKRSGRPVESPVNSVNLPVNDINSEAYKKRVIMEGLLERNRGRVVAPS